MDELKKKVSNKYDEFLSEDVQEVMNRIPSVIIRWGMTVMAVIVCGLLFIAAYLPWPETIECAFNGTIIGSNAKIDIHLSSETEVDNFLKSAINHRVRLYSSAFSNEESERGIFGIINSVTIKNTTRGYLVHIDIRMDYGRSNSAEEFSGRILLVISDLSLFSRLIDNAKIIRSPQNI